MNWSSQIITHAHALPAAVYVDTTYDLIDKQLILKPSWQLVAHLSQLNTTGDHVVCDWAGIPVITVNTGDVIQTFYNVCQHRGGPLAWKNGHSKILMCKYHGWNYHLDGRLKSAPEMQHNKNFNVCNHHLTKINTDIWQNFVFIALAPPPMTLAELITDITKLATPTTFSDFAFYRRDEFVVNCNWKVYVENYLEGYHLPHVHPGLNALLDYKSYQTQLNQWYSYQFSPIDVAGGIYGEGQAHYFFIYPNTMFNILPNRIQTNQVLPVTPDQCRVIFDYYYPKQITADIEQLMTEDRQFSDQVQQEDITICEAVQKGLASGSYQPGPLCQKRETGIHQFQEWVRTAYRQAKQ